MAATETIIISKKDAAYHKRLGGNYKLVKELDKNKAIYSVPVKTASYLKRLGYAQAFKSEQAHTTVVNKPENVQTQTTYTPNIEII